jgi:archaellum component FlaC
MTQNPGSNDRYVEALDFIITFLRDHEGKLDKLNNQLSSVVDGFGGLKGLNKKLDNLNEEIDSLDKALARLVAVYRSRQH